MSITSVCRTVGVVLPAALALAGCAGVSPNRTGTLWVQTSAEYRAVAVQTYRTAGQTLDAALADPGWTAALEQREGYADLPPAVVLDVDETVLDNSPFQGQIVLDRAGFDPLRWNAWVAMAAAEAVPGALDFVRAANSRGIRVFYITNRSCSSDSCPQEAHTIRNLETLGFPSVSGEQMLLRDERGTWGSEKTSRRRAVAKTHRILMLVGDDLGDFIPGVKRGITAGKRRDLADTYRDRWGRQWFILPNPMYGSWDQVLGEPKEKYIEGLSAD